MRIFKHVSMADLIKPLPIFLETSTEDDVSGLMQVRAFTEEQKPERAVGESAVEL